MSIPPVSTVIFPKSETAMLSNQDLSSVVGVVVKSKMLLIDGDLEKQQLTLRGSHQMPWVLDNTKYMWMKCFRFNKRFQTKLGRILIATAQNSTNNWGRGERGQVCLPLHPKKLTMRYAF